MAYLDQLGAGAYAGMTPEERIQAMLSLDTPQLAPAPEPMQPQASGDNLGAPEVLSFLKELDGRGAFKPQGQAAPKGMSAASQTVKSEEGGVPADVRAQGVAVRGQAGLDDAEVDRQRQISEADRLEAQAAKIRSDAAVATETRRQAEAENSQKQERLRGQQMELASQRDEPINGRRYFENMSALAKGSALISAAIYGYLGGRGQAPVMQSLMQLAQEDTQAQIQNNAANRDRRNTLIDQYERQYGDTTLVAKRLEADKLHTFAKQADAEAKEAKSAELRASAEDLGKKLRNRVGVLHQEIQEATFGKPVEVSTTYQANKPKGSAPDALKQAAEVVANGEKAGFSRDEIAAVLKQRGLPVPSGQSAYSRDQELQETKAKSLSPEEKTDLRKRTDGLAEMVQGMAELDNAVGFKRGADGEVIAADEKKLDDSIRSVPGQVVQSFSNALPWGIGKGAGELVQKLQPEDSKALDRARDKIVFGQAKAEGAGALGDAERESYRQRIPTDSPLSVQRASAQIWRARKQQYDNLVGQYGQAVVDEMLRERGIDPATVAGR